MTTPVLMGDALKAVRHRGSHMQIIASAGSGKTEVVSQRVVDLLADGYSPDSIVAFTFTERAAEELKMRIEARVEDRLGAAQLDRLNGLFVGTVHAYCFRLLQQHVPRYDTYDVLDENQLTAFLSREANRLEIRQLDPQGRNRVFASIAAFLESVEVIENELLDPPEMPEPFHTVVSNFYESLERYRLLTYGQQIARAVQALTQPQVSSAVHETLRHLIVDEYQDINPAQERLIELLTGPQVELCIVGDDDQAIYQWRGSDVANIVTFAHRYSPVETFTIAKNRRSRPEIIETANQFATSISGRLDKVMEPDRPASEDGHTVVVWAEEYELDEAGWIANLILDLNEAGLPYRDIAVLVRTSAAYRKLVDQFRTFDIPVQPGGRTGLFDQPEAIVLGRMFSWLSGIEWREPYQRGERVELTPLAEEFKQVFRLTNAHRNRVRRALREWQNVVPKESRPADLVDEFYQLLDVLEVRQWDLKDPLQLNRLGTLARFTGLLVDYESVRRRARPDAEVEGEQVGGQDRGRWFYKNLAIHIVNHAQGAYDGFDGEPNFGLDAVDLTTVHRAKGLEWPAVFVPSVTSSRFPSSKTGQRRDWLVPRTMFNATRYEGSDADERRLFYVALTRPRDWLSVSRHDRVNVKATAPSDYWLELSDGQIEPGKVALPEIIARSEADDEDLAITYSELAQFMTCGMEYRLRNLLGFQPRLAPELGYGKAVHHVLRTVADRTRDTGSVPDANELASILDMSFFLPTANKPAHREMKEFARRLIARYTSDHADDLYRVWETERPFELHLDGVTVSGRADVILDEEGGTPNALAILDYKTSTAGELDPYELQLQVYSAAGRREGLDVRAAFVHDLKGAARHTVDVSDQVIEEANKRVEKAAERIRDRDFRPSPGPICRSCEVRTVCPAAQI